MNADFENMSLTELYDLIDMHKEDWKVIETPIGRIYVQLDQDYQCPRSGHYADEYFYDDMEEEEESWQEF